MRVDPNDPTGTILTTPLPTVPPQVVPPPPVLQPPPPPPTLTSPPTNAAGETLAQAEAAAAAQVAQGIPVGVALANHPLPPGTSTAEALRFLASLPQTVTPIDDPGAGVIVGPPLDTLPGHEAEFGPDAEDDAEDLWEEDPTAQDTPEVHGFEQTLDGISG